MRNLDTDAMGKAIKGAILRCGSGVLADANRFQASIKVLLPGNSFVVERELLAFSVRIGVGKRLLGAVNRSASEQNKALGLADALLTVEYGFLKERSDNILNAYASALGWQYAPRDGELPPGGSHGGDRRDACPRHFAKGEIIPFGEYRWRVLCVKGSAALLLADEITDVGIPYDDTENLDGVTWEDCSLREWLNTEFLQRFPREQRSRILMSRIEPGANPWFQTEAGNQTKDKVFLLSISEVVQSFGDSSQLGAEPSGLHVIDNKFNSLRRAAHKGENTWWWLRSPGDSKAKAAYVNADGVIILKGEMAFDDGGDGFGGILPGVRPAIWIRQ